MSCYARNRSQLLLRKSSRSFNKIAIYPSGANGCGPPPQVARSLAAHRPGRPRSAEPLEPDHRSVAITATSPARLGIPPSYLSSAPPMPAAEPRQARCSPTYAMARVQASSHEHRRSHARAGPAPQLRSSETDSSTAAVTHLPASPRRGRARDLPVRRLRLAAGPPVAAVLTPGSRFRAKAPLPPGERRRREGILTSHGALTLALATGVALLPFGARAQIAASANDNQAYLDTRAAIKKSRKR